MPLRFSALQSKRVHLGVCGSVAAYKAVELLRLMQKLGLSVSVTLTESASRFITPLTFESLGADPVYTQMFGQDDGIRFAHLQPGRTAHAMVIAPATATTLARLAAGLADDMLAAQALAFPGPLVIAPAMNPHMWQHAATQANIALLTERGCCVIPPASGLVACGDSGQGKLADVEAILLQTVCKLVPQDMAGHTVLVTLGPTREPWDGVRYWTNGSTGRMGASFVYAAYLRGAVVHAVTGPGTPPLPADVHRHNVTTAREMFSAAEAVWDDCTLGVFTAAVADFSPVRYGSAKFKKDASSEGFSLSFTPNADILATLGSRAASHQKLLGFAAETTDLEISALRKLQSKKAHIIAGNYLDSPESGFASATNRVYVCDRNGRTEQWPVLEKEEVAWRLLDWLLHV